MVKTSLFSKENQEFIRKHGICEKYIGLPLRAADGLYYPIPHESLCLRYFISDTCCIYDAIEKTYKKPVGSNIITLTTTDTNTEVEFSIQELYWMAHYRFKEGARIKRKKNGARKKPNPNPIKDSDIGVHYMIEGVPFKTVNFSGYLYGEFVKVDKCKLIVSRDGAVFDRKRGKFHQVIMDGEGIPYILSSRKVYVSIPQLIALSWFSNAYECLDTDSKVDIVAPCGIFCNIYNILFYKNLPSGFIRPFATRIIFQDICPDTDSITGLEQSKCREYFRGGIHCSKKEIETNFGTLFRIPIRSLYGSYSVTRNGVVYSEKTRMILKPHRIIMDENSNYVTDIIYKFTNTEIEYSILDILAWTFYRLNKDVIFRYMVDIVMYEKVPFIRKLIIQTKCGHSINSSYQFCFGNEVFLPINKMSNNVISKLGAIFDTKRKQFVEYSPIIDKNGAFLTNLTNTIGNSKWVNIRILLYRTWHEYIGIHYGMDVYPRNGILEDISLHNLYVSNVSVGNPQNLPSIDRLNTINSSIEAYRRMEWQHLADIYKTCDTSTLSSIEPISPYVNDQ